MLVVSRPLSLLLLSAACLFPILGPAPQPLLAQTATESVLSTLDDPSEGTVIQSMDGNFAGTGASDFDFGYVFEISPAGVATNPYNFGGQPDGGQPNSAMVQGPDGNYYGASGNGGANNFGSIYKIAHSGSGWKESILYSFPGGADGCYPVSPLIFDSAGNLYGTSGAECGANSQGTIFKYNPASNTFTTLHAFCAMANCTDGGSTKSGLVEHSNGLFYGYTQNGGAQNDGAVFQISSAGVYSVIHSFCDNNSCLATEDGYSPEGSLVEGNDGNLYGVTYGGGSHGNGTVFRITTAGTLTTIYNFIGAPDGAGIVGLYPGSDGNLYGATALGGDPSCSNNGCGSVFSVSTSGSLLWYYDFTDKAGDANPYLGVPPMQGNDGAVYGTTYGTQSDGVGAVYKVVISPALPAPVELTLSQSSVTLGTQVTLSWKALNAFSTTMQNCYAFVQGSETGAGTWTGLQVGTYSSSTKLYSGSAKITPTAVGTYTYALTCGGVESGFATLTVTGLHKPPAHRATARPPRLPSANPSPSKPPSPAPEPPPPALSLSPPTASPSPPSTSTAPESLPSPPPPTAMPPATYPVIATYPAIPVTIPPLPPRNVK